LRCYDEETNANFDYCSDFPGDFELWQTGYTSYCHANSYGNIATQSYDYDITS